MNARDPRERAPPNQPIDQHSPASAAGISPGSRRRDRAAKMAATARPTQKTAQQRPKTPPAPASSVTPKAPSATTLSAMEALVPDVIPKIAKQVVTVTFKRGVEVRMGNKLTCDQTCKAPESISFQGPASAFYTVMMIDPDAPNSLSPRLRHWRHWLVMNVPNSCDLKAGDTVTEYEGPSPPKGSGLHRYVLLVYSQGTNRISERDASVPEARGMFNLGRFVTDNKLGDPLAVNYFVCERTSPPSTPPS
ncbi:protein D3-like [Dermacentor andersoni]|uniref:protein D3-like n=1 Tax=Dermacentor andersoni TaxID=34620 RepID=UPI002417D003|nr:protein D3-like [Dermacentor andersoni]